MKEEILKALLGQMKQLMAEGKGEEEVESKDMMEEAVEEAVGEPMEEPEEELEEASEEDSGIDLDKVKTISFKDLMSDYPEYQDEEEDLEPEEGVLRISVMGTKLGKKAGNPCPMKAVSVKKAPIKRKNSKRGK